MGHRRAATAHSAWRSGRHHNRHHRASQRHTGQRPVLHPPPQRNKSTLMGRLLIIPLALIAMLGAAVAWSGSGHHERANFVFINRGDIYTLDLNQMSYMQDFRLTYALREGLYGVEKTARCIPSPPTRQPATICPTIRRVWTFHLRPGLRVDERRPGHRARLRFFVAAILGRAGRILVSLQLHQKRPVLQRWFTGVLHRFDQTQTGFQGRGHRSGR